MKDFRIIWLSEKQHMKWVLVQTAFWDIDAAKLFIYHLFDAFMHIACGIRGIFFLIYSKIHTECTQTQ